jgi:hypothetical protein
MTPRNAGLIERCAMMSSAVAMECPGLSDKVIPAQFVRILDPNNRVPDSAQPAVIALAGPDGKLREPQIKLIQEGGTVKTIEVHCTCGAVIRLDCQY